MKVMLIAVAMLAAFAMHAQSLTIHFDFDSDKLTPRARQSIDSFFTAEPGKIAGAGIELSGHCDFKGSDDYNDSLSFRRVMTVKNYLQEKYIQAAQVLAIRSFGERKPLNNNKTAQEQMLNRRVEIIMTSRQAGIQDAETVAVEKPVSLKEKMSDTTTKTGSRIALKNITFYGGRHEFLPEAYPVLKELKEIMQTYPRLVIEIGGHICCQPYGGDGLDADTRNYNLSEERARAVYAYLLSNGIESTRISYKGYGHSMPIHPYPEQSEEERIENRRVEVKIISK